MQTRRFPAEVQFRCSLTSVYLFLTFKSHIFTSQVYQFQTHSHRSRLQWISSMKKAIDNSGEEVNLENNFVFVFVFVFVFLFVFEYVFVFVSVPSVFVFVALCSYLCIFQQRERYQQRQALQRRGLRDLSFILIIIIIRSSKDG